MSNVVETVEDRIQNAILNGMIHIIKSRIELAVRSMNASSGQDVASLTAISERWSQIGIFASNGSMGMHARGMVFSGSCIYLMRLEGLTLMR